jgi:ferredoxin-NADP reductase
MNAVFRKKLLWLHTWSGLTVGLVIVLLGITGAGMVLRPQLDKLVNQDLLVVPQCNARLPLDTLAATADAAHPEDQLYSIEVSPDAETSTAIKFTNKDLVYLNPCTGAILGLQNQYGGYFGIVDYLHRFRFMDGGRQFAGWMNLVFAILLVVGGIVLWWPRTKAALKGAFKFNPRLPGIARTLSLHKVVGLYTSLVLLLLTITAVPISFEPVRDFIYKATGYVEPVAPKSKMLAGAARLPMETLWQRSKSLVPEQEWASLRYPLKPGDAVAIEILERNMPHADAKSYVYLDAYSGEMLQVRHYASGTELGRKIYLYFIALHSGLVGGLLFQLVLLVPALAIPVQAYSGFSPYLRRKFRASVKTSLSLRLAKKTVEATDICTFELADPKGKMLPPFSAGSHIDVLVRDGLIRQYSLCNDPKDTHSYLIGVLRHHDSRGGSRTLHDEFNEGDIVEISVPKNHFPLAHSAKRTLLIAGGIGVTPILCMAERLANIGADFTMHYCTRSLDRTAFVDRIKRSTYANRVHFHYNDGPPEQLADFPALLDRPDPDTHLYVCGPTGLMDVVITTATQKGWLDANVHREYFAAVGHDSANDAAFDVKIASTGKLIHVGKDKTVVAALAEAGIDIPTSCAEGVCGTCLTRVLEGEMEHHDMFLTAEERGRNDQFTPCCSRARSPMLVLDL